MFGWQYFYAGGSSRSAIAFTAYEQYLHHIERARLGDHFTLFELDALLDRAIVHIGDIHSTGRLALDEPVVDLADEDAEVLIVRRLVGPLTRAVDATVTELPGTSDERLEQFKRDLVWGRGELVIFDQRVFDEDEHGGLVSTVTAKEGRRINALVEAQRPSPEGTVPLAGPY